MSSPPTKHRSGRLKLALAAQWPCQQGAVTGCYGYPWGQLVMTAAPVQNKEDCVRSCYAGYNELPRCICLARGTFGCEPYFLSVVCVKHGAKDMKYALKRVV